MDTKDQNYTLMRQTFLREFPGAIFHDTTGECVAHHAEQWKMFKLGWQASSTATAGDHESRLDVLMCDTFDTNHPAMHDYALLKMDIKRLNSTVSKLEAELRERASKDQDRQTQDMVTSLLYSRLREERTATCTNSRIQADIVLEVVAPVVDKIKPNYSNPLFREFREKFNIIMGYKTDEKGWRA